MMIKKNGSIRLITLLLIVTVSFQKKEIKKRDSFATVKIVFNNTVKNSRIYLYDSTYTNPFGEKYTITKFRYYVSDIFLKSTIKNAAEKNSYHLIDQGNVESQSFSFPVAPGDYTSLNFLLGVDSLHNVSGAQTGALDPTKDMFWTWNSGYVMAKLEGNSPSSTLVNNKFEFHIGGYAGEYNVLKNIQLSFPEDKPIYFASNKTITIIINADVNAWWHNPNEIKIAEHANITSPGKLALAISDNYKNMFHIEKIITGN
ncbi:MAG: hypothetical protein Q8891_00540 [Bacteroidota bacterium]|nr:hypothetical protein [Bacteroidota bacterium]